MSRRSHRQRIMARMYEAGEKHEKHRYTIEVTILILADLIVRIMVEPDHVKHGITMLLSMF